MATYMGNLKIKTFLGDSHKIIKLISSNPIINGIKTFSSDNYLIKDCKNSYITVKESE